MSSGGDLRSLLRSAHARGWMLRHGVWDIFVEMRLSKDILIDEGIPVEFKHRGKSYESWSMLIRGREYHLRVQETPYGPRENAIYLKDAWQNGKAVAVWRTPKDVRKWFDGITA
jgi:hypothetical protein